ncbi:hypothetical protein Sjap_015121 [Stephania japonica]|uniref:Uncharacterized protein n=1 Tax=Stephania japonica TaxID=461633 RepID=A0AAP0III8_9MAGN
MLPLTGLGGFKLHILGPSKPLCKEQMRKRYTIPAKLNNFPITPIHRTKNAMSEPF